MEYGNITVGNFTNASLDGPAPAPDWVSPVLVTITGLICAATIAGNLMVILSVGIFRGLRNVPNTLLTSLAAADFVMGAVVMPLGSYYLYLDEWALSKLACELWISLDVLSVTASIGTLGAISVDRYIAVATPFKYPRLVTRRRARIAIVAIWAISFVMALVPVQCGWWKSTQPGDVACYEDPKCCEFVTNTTYAVVSSTVSFYIPLLVMVISYYIVFKAAKQIEARRRILNQQLRRASSSASRYSRRGSTLTRRRMSLRRNSVMDGFQVLLERRNRRSLAMAKIIMGTFVVCWLPFFIVNIAQVFCDRCVGKTVFTFFNWLGYSNSMFNPFIYCHSGRFRRAFKKLLACQLCRKGYRQTSRGSLSYPHAAKKRQIAANNSLPY